MSRSSAASPSSTRQQILDAAVESLIELGTARTTTLGVQHRAGVSRGALLHHFPTLAQLLAATVDEIVQRNEQAVVEALGKLQGTADPVERAIRVLASATTQPAYLAELELWAVSRTDADLRAALVAAEKRARKESDRVLRALFSSAGGDPGHVMAMTMELLRGLALSGVLRTSPTKRQQIITQWISLAKSI